MLYLEDYLEMIEHLPAEFRDRFTEIREMDLSVQNRIDSLSDRQKTFFANCQRKLKAADREDEYEKIRAEYQKVIEDSNEKVNAAEECYTLVDRYLRKLDEELLKFKLELEADNRGITEILEKQSLEMDAPQPVNLKENRQPKKTARKNSLEAKSNSASASVASSSSMSSDFLLPQASTSRMEPASAFPGQKQNKNFFGDFDPSMSAAAALASNPGPSGSSTLPLQHMGPGGSAIAAAASQAIAATQQLSGRRTSSLKASYEAINMGVAANEFSVGRELAGAAQAAIANTSFEGSSGSTKKSKKKGANAAAASALVDPSDENLFSSGYLDVLGGGQDGNASAAGGADQGEWNYDPNEPRYCICNQVSYGDMVACDNDDCPYEWFHYPCVGITAPPKGKWFCPTCQANMARRKSRK